MSALMVMLLVSLDPIAAIFLERMTKKLKKSRSSVSVRQLRIRTIIPRHQLVLLVDFMVSDPFQNPCEPCLRISLIQPGGFDQSEGDSHGISTTL